MLKLEMPFRTKSNKEIIKREKKREEESKSNRGYEKNY